MKRFGVIAAVVAAFVALGAPATAWASHGHHHNKHHGNSFTVLVRDADATVTPADFFTSTPVSNAQATEDAPVYNEDGSEQIGLAETVYTITRVAGTDVDVMVECSVELPDGNILFNGTAHLADVTTGADIPVVGGTGAYARAAGVVTATGASDGSTTTLDFDISTK